MMQAAQPAIRWTVSLLSRALTSSCTSFADSSTEAARCSLLAAQPSRHFSERSFSHTCCGASTPVLDQPAEQHPGSAQPTHSQCSSSTSHPHSSSSSSSISHHQRLYQQRVFSTYGPGSSGPSAQSAQDQRDDKARWQALSAHSREVSFGVCRVVKGDCVSAE